MCNIYTYIYVIYIYIYTYIYVYIYMYKYLYICIGSVSPYFPGLVFYLFGAHVMNDNPIGFTLVFGWSKNV